MTSSFIRYAIFTITPFILLQLVGCKTRNQNTPIKTATTLTTSAEKENRFAKKKPATTKTDDVSNKRLPMIPGKPLFSLLFDFKNCRYAVYVNGGIVAADTAGEPIEAEIPINHWLRSGSNEIEVQMIKWPNEPDLCEIKLDLVCMDATAQSGTNSGATVVSTLAHSAKAAAAGDPYKGSSDGGLLDSKNAFQPSDQGDVLVGPPQIKKLNSKYSYIQVLYRSINLNLPFPEWLFFHGEYVKPFWEWENEEASESTYKEIEAAYMKVWRLLAARDIRGFLVACEERSREMDIAYYKKPGETRERLRRSLEIAMNNADLELATLDGAPDETWVYDVGSTGTLIALTQGARSASIFRFQRKDGTPFSYVFPVIFRKEDNKYIVTR